MPQIPHTHTYTKYASQFNWEMYTLYTARKTFCSETYDNILRSKMIPPNRASSSSTTLDWVAFNNRVHVFYFQQNLNNNSCND